MQRPSRRPASVLPVPTRRPGHLAPPPRPRPGTLRHCSLSLHPSSSFLPISQLPPPLTFDRKQEAVEAALQGLVPVQALPWLWRKSMLRLSFPCPLKDEFDKTFAKGPLAHVQGTSLWFTPSSPAWGLLYSSQALSSLRRKASFRRGTRPAGRWLPPRAPWLPSLPAWTFTACNLVTLDYLTLDPASPALHRDLFWPAACNWGSSPADAGPRSLSTDQAALWLYNRDAASWAPDPSWAVTMTPMGAPAWSLVPEVSSEFTPAAKQDLVCLWLSRSLHKRPLWCLLHDTRSSEARDISGWNRNTSHQHIPFARTNFPTQPRRHPAHHCQILSLIYWAFIMCQAL